MTTGWYDTKKNLIQRAYRVENTHKNILRAITEPAKQEKCQRRRSRIEILWFGKCCRCVNSGECHTLGKPQMASPFCPLILHRIWGFLWQLLVVTFMKSWPSWHFLWLFKRGMEKWSRKCTEASLLCVLCKCKRESTCWKRQESISLHKFPIGIKEVLRVKHVWFLPLWLVSQNWGQ